jgi:protein gp37
MADKSRIEWTEATWNPTTGCDRVSPGCDHCYAMTLAPRLKAMGSKRYQRDGDPRTSGPGFGLSLHSDTVSLPLRWTKPRRIFVNSMSDLFHDDVPPRFIAEVFSVMARTPQHTFQLLTKRHGRMRSLLSGDLYDLMVRELTTIDGPPTGLTWPLPNVWLGVSVEDQKWAGIRIPALLDTPAAVRWLSMEPLLGPVDLTVVPGLDGQWGHAGRHHGSGAPDCPRDLHHHHDDRCRFPLDWVVVGGESGLASRPMQVDWARSLRDQCTSAGVPFFFKQWGGRTPKANGRELDGRTWDEYPS